LKLNANNGVPGSILFPNGIALTDGATSSQVNIGGDVTLLISAYISARVVAKTPNYTVTAADTEKCLPPTARLARSFSRCPRRSWD
jgi:hypothetical protein